jgi:L-threonylcarbamoyladenylate synthase
MYNFGMKKINISDSKALDETVKVLKNGGIVMHPTETCYGLAVDIFNEVALNKLYKLKGMSRDKPLSILVDGFGMANEYGIFSDKAFELAESHWPGPLSIIVPKRNKLPECFNFEEDFVSIRYSSNEFCTEMVKAFGRPVTTTSANRAGEKSFYSAKVGDFGKFLDLVVDGGEISQNKPSTIVKVDGDRVEVIRQGDIVLE